MSLALTQLIGFGAAEEAGGGAPPEASGISTLDTQVQTNTSAYSQTHSFGDEPGGGATRHILAAIKVHDDDANNGTPITAVTIGGVAATQIKVSTVADQFSDSSGTQRWTYSVQLWLAEVPTGASGTVAVSLAITADIVRVHLMRVIGLASPTPTTTPTGAANITLNVPSGGVGVVAAIRNSGLGTDTPGAWSGTPALTESYRAAGLIVGYRTASGSAVHDSSSCTQFIGATWTFI